MVVPGGKSTTLKVGANNLFWSARNADGTLTEQHDADTNLLGTDTFNF
jgi:hypothetical protein